MNYILKIDCYDEKGLILRVSEIVFKNGLNYVSTSEFVDHENERFYMRAVMVGDINVCEFKNTLSAFLPKDAIIFCEEITKKDVVVLATKESHCLGDLLIKHSSGELNANILAVIANHDTLKPLTEKFDIPFHLVSADGISREEHENLVLNELKKYKFNYMILAKYMRILSSNFVKNYPKKIINIHHSFLPAFIGANPYKQAHERGVKIIGATAHFVTDDLDEGPIITQDVIRVNHEMSWRDMQRAGKNVEKVVLSNALDLVFDERVFVYKNKTVIF
ncbi:formyltetrahydrofolate deformylase [Campylobacter fetus]|uniref:formyltetrahydrofolate deformylase n=1 Tax=Campylobacter fetus TaxID=196 RepID=UPI00073A7EBC|nr:formyltetrahydrofolate deformylase [Campylobacter fetus]ALV64839.1 formyltetrahydrofolate deformylase [Campylobacter fetus subsp. testudinum Sp3]EAK0826115.1 formyltetrahydrofolate deformylase [Campylobacter fetus]OCR86003.1 formyltetrahydrofolate deformylase [Campylobacter fetus subsp. testudinum]OCR89797.1 formyltetrahydrofolate deformylase [Campylobacter fetus subsp. testudinum]OCR93484.1 formyltetrahydrofolate deformylase [Campylobacter fetus subsp. testudinum]